MKTLVRMHMISIRIASILFGNEGTNGLLKLTKKTFLIMSVKCKYSLLLFFAGLRLNNAWASGTVTKFGLRLQVQASGFEHTTPILEAARSNH